MRSFAAVAIRKNLSAFSEKSYVNLWNELTPEVQQQVKQLLFAALSNENDSAIRHQICDAIGEIGGTLIEHQDQFNQNQPSQNKWPELPGLIMQLLSCPTENLIESGLKILATLFTYASETFVKEKDALSNIFRGGLGNASKNIKLATMEALGSFVEIVEPKHTKKFEELIPLMLEATYALLNEDETYGEDALTVISDIVETEPKFFKKNFGLLFESMHKITFDKVICFFYLKKSFNFFLK